MSLLGGLHHQARSIQSTVRRLAIGIGKDVTKANRAGPFLPKFPLQRDLIFRRNTSRFLSTQPLHPPHQVVVLKPWKNEMVESHGDYRAETYLEKHIGGPLYENQNKLPKLPIPDIQDTLERFLSTATPLAKTKEEASALKDAVTKFPEQAKILQERLQARRDGEMKDSSWLQLWWNQMGYLQVRDPTVVNVSYFFHFVDDPTIDTTTTTTTTVGDNSFQSNIQRGAAMLFGAAEFRKLVCSGQLPAEKVGKKQTPLCSTAYKYMFHACRIPRRNQDSYRIYDPSRNSHCIVARKGHFFAVEMTDPESGDPLPVPVLESQLQKCIEMADDIPSSRPKLGVLTTGNRDDWADARETLLTIGGLAMEEALEKLESGAILLNLDDEAPVSRQECGEIFLTGGLKSGENRWFDKSVQIMVANNGKTGILGEHSMMDGMPLVNLANHLTHTSYADAKKRSSDAAFSMGGVTDIFEYAMEQMDRPTAEALEEKACKSFQNLVTSQSNHAQSFQGYGSTFIKQAGYSPDAFVQVAMQLATYRLFGEQVGTYEATQVRSYYHGRTETTRSVSTASAAFVKKMGMWPKMDEDDPDHRKEKVALLQEAAKAHVEYTRIAAQAQGVDRHFFGLSLLVNDGEEAPDLYSDPVFARSKRWRLSTSHLTHPRFANWGFGPVFPDGVGVAYAILPRSCVFNITALRETGWSDKLSELLEETLLEMQRLVELDSPPDSKL